MNINFKKIFNYFAKNRLIVLILLITFTLITVLLSSEIYNLLSTNYEVGQVSNEKIKAPRKIVNQPETDKLEEEASNSVQNYYKIDSDITEAVYKEVESFFTQLDDEREVYKSYIENSESLESNEVLENGETTLEEPIQSQVQGELIENIDYTIDAIQYDIVNVDLLQTLSEVEILYLCELSDEDYKSYKEFINTILDDVLEQGIKSDGLLNSFLLVEDFINKQSLDETISDITYKVVVGFLRPNLVIDESATEKAKEEAIANVEPVYYLEGQTIVDEGEIISNDMYVVLDDLGYIDRNISELIISYSAVIALNLIFTLFVLIYTYFYKKSYIYDLSITAITCTLYIFFVISTIFLDETIICYMPLYVAIYIFTVFLDKKIVSVILINLMFLLSNFTSLSGNEMLFLFLTANMEILFVNKINDKNRIFFGSLLVSLLFGVIYTLIYVTEGYKVTEVIMEIYKIPLTTFVAIIFSYGVSPAIASTFGILTNSRLIELTRPDQALIRRLTMEASGTYQHSLVVANLSEEAALNIGANSALCRVASYYHDVGKLQNPLYFGENQNGYNPHDDLNPLNSAKIILNHTEYGKELATKYKLPKEIIEIIPQHHGSTKVSYFYSKALNDESLKDKITEEMFTYSGEIPQSKEAAIIMLADTAEAAVRSVIYKMNGFEEIEEFLTKLINGKINEGQLLDSGLTFKDIEKIKKSFMRIFKGMYHSRVEYPSKKGEKNEK